MRDRPWDATQEAAAPPREGKPSASSSSWPGVPHRHFDRRAACSSGAPSGPLRPGDPRRTPPRSRGDGACAHVRGAVRLGRLLLPAPCGHATGAARRRAAVGGAYPAGRGSSSYVVRSMECRRSGWACRGCWCCPCCRLLLRRPLRRRPGCWQCLNEDDVDLPRRQRCRGQGSAVTQPGRRRLRRPSRLLPSRSGWWGRSRWRRRSRA